MAINLSTLLLVVSVILCIVLSSSSSFANGAKNLRASSSKRFARRKCDVPGLWCGKKKRESPLTKDDLSRPGTQRQKQVEKLSSPFTEPSNTMQKRAMEKIASRCPPGLWCGRKREIHKSAPENKPMNEVFRRAATSCPPGLWCGRKRSLAEQDYNRFQLALPEVAADDEYPDVENGDQEWRDVLRELFRKRAASFDTGAPPRQRSLEARFEPSCPPGLWCGKK